MTDRVELEQAGDTDGILLQLATSHDIMSELIDRGDPFIFMVDRETYGDEVKGLLDRINESYQDARRKSDN